jgi:hypothetical protein
VPQEACGPTAWKWERKSRGGYRQKTEDMSGAIRLVTFCQLPIGYLASVPMEEWNDVPAITDDYSKARDVIVERIKHLLDELKPTDHK